MAYVLSPSFTSREVVQIIRGMRGKPEVTRFKGLGEMTAAQLKETTMNPATRTIARVVMPEDDSGLDDLFEALMGKKPESRFKFIQENAKLAGDLDL